MIITGSIIKGIAGFYYVESGGTLYECKARGVFKNKKEKPSVGDRADVDTGGATPVIVRIHDRRNLFQRPPVSNIDQFVVVSALADPEPNLAIVDRFLAMAEHEGVEAVVCFTKCDLAGEAAGEEMRKIYEPVYPVVILSNAEETRLTETRKLLPYLKGKSTALAGPSGVGKSTILNALRGSVSSDHMLTGSVSEKTGRGKHTTRHVELFRMDFGGYVFDTPGFTSFDTPDVSEADLQFLFPDIEACAGSCRFNGCRHMAEPGCAVRTAVEEGRIHEMRYRSYRLMMSEIKEREERRYR